MSLYKGTRVTEEHENKRYEPGQYKFKVTSAEIKTAQSSGNQYISLDIKCDNGELDFDVRFVNFFHNSSSPVMQDKFNSFLTVVGCVDKKGEPDLMDINELMSKTGRVLLANTETAYKGDVKSFLKPLDFGAWYADDGRSATEINSEAKKAEKIHEREKECEFLVELSPDKYPRNNDLPAGVATQNANTQEEEDDLPF